MDEKTRIVIILCATAVAITAIMKAGGSSKKDDRKPKDFSLNPALGKRDDSYYEGRRVASGMGIDD